MKGHKLHVRFWRTLAEGLRQGRPLAACLAEAGEKLAGTVFEGICEAARRELPEGTPLSRTIAAFPDVFDNRVVEAVAEGERTGVLDAKLARIAEAIEADDLAVLNGGGAVAAAGERAGEALELIRGVIREAVEARASDIHVEPTEGGGRVRLRIDGVLHEQRRLVGEVYAAAVDRLKALAALDLAERRLPQDGRILLELEAQKYDLRVSTLPAAGGERIVCRVLARQNIPLGLGNVGLSAADASKVRDFCRLPSGMVIVNGPTGCGKTTVLYGMLMEVNRDACCVITIEDPVEVMIEGLSQVQIRPSTGLTFARCIRSALRQDPDVIMVGELRDLEMMNLCVQVALTGHLVLTTLHAQDSVGAIRRLVDCGLAPFLINSTLQGVVTPRLVRVLCQSCKRPARPAEHSMPPEALQIVSGLTDAEFCEPVGCEDCRGTGYRGRTGVFEILAVDERIRQAIGEPLNMAAVSNAARARGMKTMLQDGLAKAARGITSVGEVLRVVPPEPGS